MIKIDLITGFLGAGKTTFIKKYVQYLKSQGNYVGILENDYGAVNVDMMLFSELLDDRCDIEMVAGGCDRDCYRRRFKTKLIAMGMSGYDRVVVEPSGIFDVEEFFDLLQEEPINRWYEIGSVISIVDAEQQLELSENSRYIMATQIASAGKLVISKTENVEPQKIDELTDYIKESLALIKCDRQEELSILRKPWKDLGDQDFLDISESGYCKCGYLKRWFSQSDEYSAVYIMDRDIDINHLEDIIKELFQDDSCGQVMRIKGFVDTANGWLEVNATKNHTHTQEIDRGQKVVIVIGSGIVEEKIQEYFH